VAATTVSMVAATTRAMVAAPRKRESGTEIFLLPRAAKVCIRLKTHTLKIAKVGSRLKTHTPEIEYIHVSEPRLRFTQNIIWVEPFCLGIIFLPKTATVSRV
jgi:hypothetical protein